MAQIPHGGTGGADRFRGILSWEGQKIPKRALCTMDAVGGSAQSQALLTSYWHEFLMLARIPENSILIHVLPLCTHVCGIFTNSLYFPFICSWKQESVLYSHGTLQIPTQIILELISSARGALLAALPSTAIYTPTEFSNKALLCEWLRSAHNTTLLGQPIPNRLHE